MKTRTSLTTQIGMGIFVALTLGSLFQASAFNSVPPVQTILPTEAAITPVPSVEASPTPLFLPPTPSPTPRTTPRPFNTLPGAWLARVLFYPDQPPQIERVLYLQQGRLTPSQPGDVMIDILTEEGEILLQQSLQVAYFAGDPPRELSEVTAIIVLPVLEDASLLQIAAPQGIVSATLPLP